MALFIVDRVGTGFTVRPGDNALQAAASALTAAAWAEGALPGGAGTKSAKEWAWEADGHADRSEAARDVSIASSVQYPSAAEAVAGLADGAFGSYLDGSGNPVWGQRVGSSMVALPGPWIGADKIGFLQAGAGARKLTTQTKLEQLPISIFEFMTDAEITDYLFYIASYDLTAKIEAAIAAAPKGGAVEFPRGLGSCNIVINRDDVTLIGAGLCDWTYQPDMFGLKPYNPANPVIQVGNDTRYVSGVGFREMSICSPDGLGMCGLRLAGGTYGFSADGLHIVGFKKHCLWAQNGATYPVTYTNISRYTFSTGPTGTMAADAAAIYAYYAAGGPSSFTTGLFFSQGQIVFRTVGARAVWLDGVQMFMANTYIEAGGVTRQGAKFAKTNAGAETPVLHCSNVTIDGDTTTAIVCEGNLTSLYIADYIRGLANVDGLIENSAGVTAPTVGGNSYTQKAQLIEPRSFGSHLFPSETDPADTSARIYGDGSVAARNMNITGSRIDLRPGANGVRVLSPAGDSSATINLLDQLNNRQCRVRNGAGTLLLSAPAGYGIQAGDGAWNGNPLRLGNYFLWVDSTGDLRIKSGAPTSDTDGTIVGTQT